MANPYRSLVNQRLYFCSLHIEWLGDQIADQAIARAVAEQALGESIVFHLIQAYQCYLSEIASSYSIDADNLQTAEQLVGLLAGNKQSSAEAQELLACEAPESWLGKLIQQHHMLGSVQMSNQTPNTKRSLPSAMISAVEVDATLDFSLERLQTYLKNLKAIIENQRSRLEEW